ncbi:Probable geranylgeranyl reductase [Mycobacteroides abscessus subsp. abscessus]|nr:Probable geranylgeranyl reductase [Mycobacteroides abscessus subsp. abscessus]
MVLATGLSTVAGFLDAIGFVHLGGYFLSFMSGNTTRMAASTATLNWESAYKAAGLIGMFFIGVMIGAIASRVSGEHERVAVLAVASTTVAAAAITQELGAGVAALLVTSLAMGAMNSVFQRSGEVQVGLTYITGTVVKAGQRLVDAFFGGALQNAGPQDFINYEQRMNEAWGKEYKRGRLMHRAIGNPWLCAQGIKLIDNDLFRDRMLKVLYKRAQGPGHKTSH